MSLKVKYQILLLSSLMGIGTTVNSAMAANELIFNSGNKQVQLIELFTSQGCSSCPPADKWINRYTADPQLWKSIVPVAFHVDYWDYLGWRDKYAASSYSERQRRYRTQGKVRSVYTPGFVIDGGEWRGWFSGNNLPPVVSIASELRARIDQNGLMVSYPAGKQKLVLNVAILGFGIETPVKAGENDGKKLRHDFVVLAHNSHISSNGDWSVELPAIRVREAKRFALALWVSTPDGQVPLQATGGWLPEGMVRRL